MSAAARMSDDHGFTCDHCCHSYTSAPISHDGETLCQCCHDERVGALMRTKNDNAPGMPARSPRRRHDDVDHYTSSAVPSGSPSPRPAAPRGSSEILEKLLDAIAAVDVVKELYWDEMADTDPATSEFKRINAKIMATLEAGKGLRELRNDALQEARS